MFKFIKNIFSTSKKTFPEKSNKTAILYLVAKGINQPQKLQMLAMGAGVPIFFSYIKRDSVGRCGLSKVEFPPKDFAAAFILDNIANYIKVMEMQGIEFEIESEGLCETDYKELVKYLREN